MPSDTPTVKLRTWTDQNACSGCNHCGMDPDMEPYCAHPTVLEKHQYGLVIEKAIERFCGDGDKLKLWEPRQRD